MDRCGVQTAAKLLAKAQSTVWDAESLALVEKSYRLLAAVLNAADDEAASAGGPRRRERRYRGDRRAGRRAVTAATPASASDAGVTYRRAAEGLRPRAGAVDLTA
jgi:hypothetical protein